MIISHEHSFVFVQVPTTGSTFLGRFFEQEFGGEPILDKHSTYTDFLEIATQEQASYRSIIGKRHPLDMLTTRFARRINRSGVRHGSIEETQADFERWIWGKFLSQEHKRLNPHIKRSYPFVEHVIKQECLAEDLETVLKRLGLEAPPAQLWNRRTKGKLHDYTEYYKASIIPHALEKFKLEMDMLGYEAPESWKA